MLRTVFLSTTTLALAITAALAGPTNSMLSNGAAVTTVTRGYETGGFSHTRTPIGGTVLFDSIGSGGYNCCTGWTLSGPSSQIGEQIWAAIQITPSANAVVKHIAAGVGYVTGNNAAELAIYKDASGVPGTMVWSGDVSNLPVFGSTSTGTVVARVTGVRIKANKPFWVAIQTDTNSMNTWNAWNLSNTTNAPLAENTGTGWTNFGSNTAGAVTLYGRLR